MPYFEARHFIKQTNQARKHSKFIEHTSTPSKQARKGSEHAKHMSTSWSVICRRKNI